MLDLLRTEGIYLEKCRLQDCQDKVYPNLERLLKKLLEIKDAMENVHHRKSTFNSFYLEDFIMSIRNQADYIHESMASYKFIMEKECLNEL